MKKLERFIIAPEVDVIRSEMNEVPFIGGCYGTVVYDPYRGGMKNNTNWWMVVEVPGEITDFYRSLVEKQYGMKLQQPAWGPHISIIRGEKPTEDKMNLWKKIHGKKVHFEYRPYLRYNGDTQNNKHDTGTFWFIDVRCQEMVDIRAELGLPHDWLFHITVGRRND